MAKDNPIRVLYSYPHKLGADRICYTAWEQVNGLAEAGARIRAFPGVLHKPVHPDVTVHPTLARGKLRLPYKVLGNLRTCALHDWLVARKLRELAGQIDIVHTWPLGSLNTLTVAHQLGIATVLERPNAHTRFAYTVVQEECDRLGVTLPPNHEHAYKHDVLSIEEEEYQRAFRLLCPSEFTAKTFVDQGISSDRLVRHIYGYDEKRFFPVDRTSGRNFTVLFVGVCAVRKGVHYALEAWLRSPAHRSGRFLIAGEFLPEYKRKLSALLSHPSVELLGHRNDIPELMRMSDALILPSIEEGFGLVCTEAIGSGCVPIVSNACTDVCRHMDNALVHRVGDVAAIEQHITMLYENRPLLQALREGCLRTAPEVTWKAAGVKLLRAYREVIDAKARETGQLSSCEQANGN